MILKVKKVLERFVELQIANEKKFRVEKVLKRKDDKLCVKREGYDFF